MFRWKKKLSNVFMAEPDEFELFMNPGEAEIMEPAGGGEEEEVIDDLDDTDSEESNEDGEVIDEDSDEDLSDDDSDSDDSDDSDDLNLSADQTTIQALQEQNKKLMALVENLTKKEEPEEVPDDSISDPFESDMLDSMAETFNWDSVEKNAFKAFFKQYTDSVVSNTLKQAKELTPKVVNESLSQQQKVEAVRKDFYSRHPALENVKAYVGQVASQLAQENKNASLNQILEEAAKRSYQVFGLKENNSGNRGRKAEKGKSPAFPKTKGARKKAPKKTALQSDIAAMLALDE